MLTLQGYNTPEYKALLWRIPLLVLMIVEFASLQNYITLQPSFTALGLFIQSSLFYCFFEIIHYYIRLYRRVPPWWIASSTVILLTLDATGDYLNWYAKFKYFDAMLHFFAPLVATLGIWSIRRTFQISTTYKTLFFSIAPCVVTLVALYEMEEYLEDLITGSQRLGNGFDTANDLLMGFFGAFLPVTLHYIWHQLKHSKSSTDKRTLV